MEISYDWIPSTTVEWIFLLLWTSLMAFLPYFLFRKISRWMITVGTRVDDLSGEELEVAPVPNQSDLNSREVGTSVKQKTEESMIPDQKGAGAQVESSVKQRTEETMIPDQKGAGSQEESSVKQRTEETMIPDQKSAGSQEETISEIVSVEISDETSNDFPSCSESKEEKSSSPSKYNNYRRDFIPCPKDYEQSSASDILNNLDKLPKEGLLAPSVDLVYWKSWLIEEGDEKWMVRVPALSFHHYGHTFDPVYPRGLSLESCEGDSKPNFIHFTSHVVLENGLAKLQSPGSVMKTPPIPLYFNHVLYSFKLVAETNTDGFDFSVFCDVGPHLSTGESMYEKCNPGSSGSDYRNPGNDIKGLKPPDLLRVEIIIFNNEGEMNKKITLKKRKNSNCVFHSPKPIKKSEFLLSSKPNTDKNVVDFHCEVHIYTKREYFSLERLIKANTTKFRSDADKRRKIERILRGEKLDNATWTILLDTKGERKSGINEFYMEEKILMGKRTCFDFAIADGKMKMDRRKKEIILHDFEKEDMKFLIPVFYNERVPMIPTQDKTRTLGRIAEMFKDGLLERIIDEYQYEMINRALAIDPTIDSVDSFIELISMLTIIFGVSRGAMPLAKRIAVGVLADMMHLHIPDEKFPNYPDGMFAKISQDAFDLSQHELFHPLIHSAMLHRMKVRSVRKEGLKTMPE